MTKTEIDAELSELIARFKKLKKAVDEEETLSKMDKVATSLKKAAVQDREQMAAQQLSALLSRKGLPGFGPTPKQPTDDELFGHLVTSEKDAAKLEKSWGNSINDWMAEVTKPINARFKSKEEERAYWDSLKIDGGGGVGDGGEM